MLHAMKYLKICPIFFKSIQQRPQNRQIEDIPLHATCKLGAIIKIFITRLSHFGHWGNYKVLGQNIHPFLKRLYYHMAVTFIVNIFYNNVVFHSCMEDQTLIILTVQCRHYLFMNILWLSAVCAQTSPFLLLFCWNFTID